MHYSVGGCDSTFTYVEKESVNSEDRSHQAPRRLRVVIVTVSGLDILRWEDEVVVAR